MPTGQVAGEKPAKTVLVKPSQAKFRALDKKGKWRYWSALTKRPENIIKSTFGQFTGYKDRKGVNIYDGDIIKCRLPTRGLKAYLLITFRDGGFWAGSYRLSELRSMRVVANLHEPVK